MMPGRQADAFQPAGERGADVDDVIEVGRATPRWLAHLCVRWARLRYGTPVLLCVALAVIGVVAWRTVVHRETPTAVSRTDLTRIAAPPAFNSAQLVAVRALAHQICPQRGYLAQRTPIGACAFVTRARSPFPRIRRAVHDVAPQYRIIDTAFVADPSTGSDDIQIRAANQVGDVLVLSTAAPPSYVPLASFDRVETGIGRGRRVTTEYAFAVTSTGFRILVGATGPARGLPSSNDLLRLARAPAMIW